MSFFIYVILFHFLLLFLSSFTIFSNSFYTFILCLCVMYIIKHHILSINRLHNGWIILSFSSSLFRMMKKMLYDALYCALKVLIADAFVMRQNYFSLSHSNALQWRFPLLYFVHKHNIKNMDMKSRGMSQSRDLFFLFLHIWNSADIKSTQSYFIVTKHKICFHNSVTLYAKT